MWANDADDDEQARREIDKISKQSGEGKPTTLTEVDRRSRDTIRPSR